MDLLQKRDLNDFSNNLKNIFNLMTIAGSSRVIGSSSLTKTKYGADYDLDELFEKKHDGRKLLTKIYNLFKAKFKKAKQDKNVFITDFKCGLDTNGEPLRWDYKDMMKGYKTLEDGRKMDFEDCLIIKATIKLDIIALIDGIFTEFSQNYYFKMGDEGNFFPHDIMKDHILNELKHSYDEYLNVNENYLKALKRSFAYKTLENAKKNRKQIEKMLKYFNSNMGIANKARAELDILLMILENTFRKPDLADIKYNLQMIAKSLQPLELNRITSQINKLENKSTKPALMNGIEKVRNQLYHIINKKTLDYISKNKNLLIY